MPSPSRSLSVLLIDDHALFRTGLRLLLADHWPDAILHEAVTVESALDIQDLQPDLVLLDMNLPGVPGLSGLPMLRARFGDAPIVIVSAQDDDVAVQAARDRGVWGFLSKTAPPDQLVEALRQVSRGLPAWIRSSTCSSMADASNDDDLGQDGVWRPSQMQRRILALLGSHRSNKALARALSLSENQARAEVSVLMERLGVISRDAAHQVARQQGWIQDDSALSSGSLSAS